MELGGASKRGRGDGSVNGNGVFKRSKSEMESNTTGIGSKSKPCTKFFSISGCPFGEGCHFLHFVPGGIKAVTQILGNNPAIPPAPRNPVAPPSFPDGSSPPAVKTRLCKRFASGEGCKFGDKCNFAHGERELGRPTFPSHEDPRAMAHHKMPPGRYSNMGRADHMLPNMGPPTSFGASSSVKISIDASMAGAVIGKSGVNSKQICRMTGAKLSVRDHETNPNLRNIELEGTFDQINQASQMVQELMVNVSSSAAGQSMKSQGTANYGPGSNNFKTKLCDNFMKGTCTFGDKCHFAHGPEEMRRSGI
ncbi:hypothetical protein CASFOL_008601 [Castilleja foliolosa]|uniref:C3H1-type domain-containing protein n=1 Tax=Castilleja foliolosa TaxID=1961234 RepID=A0ABD3DZG1_9LAMI